MGVIEGIVIDQEAAEQVRRKGRFRLLIVQTGTGLSSEAQVLLNLLSRLQTTDPLDILLFQGVGSGGSSAAADHFAAIPRVLMHSVPMGSLGRPAVGRAGQAAKLMHVARLRLGRPSLIAQAQAFRPNLVYSAQQKWDTAIAAPLARALHVPYLIHLHYRVEPSLGEGALRRLMHADAIVAVSDPIRREAIDFGLDPGRITVVHNSVLIPSAMGNEDREAVRQRLREELRIASSSIIVGMVARMTEVKGQYEVLEAMLPLWPVHHNVHLVFAGREEGKGIGLTETLRARAYEAGCSDHVHFLGHRNDVPRLLDGFDIFAHPSRHEPFGLAVTEAMAHSLPVVAWREGGIAEQVDDQRTGILVAPLDISGLRAAIARLVVSPDLRTSMGIAARERAATVFTPERAAQSFRDIFVRIAAGQCSGSTL